MILLMVRWGRTRACFTFHGPLQKELVDIIPPSLTVALCDHSPAHMPGCFHGFLLRRESAGRRRIPCSWSYLRSRLGRRHHDNGRTPQRVQQNLSFVIIPLKPFIRTVKDIWAWMSIACATLKPFKNIGVWCSWRIRSCIWIVYPRHRRKGAYPSKPLGTRVVSKHRHLLRR